MIAALVCDDWFRGTEVGGAGTGVEATERDCREREVTGPRLEGGSRDLNLLFEVGEAWPLCRFDEGIFSYGSSLIV